MKAYAFISLGILLLCSAFVFADAPELGGEWIDGWYLHSDAEFDLIGDGCRTCHPEMSRTKWYCGDGWYSFYEF